ncbi:MAG: hypothetical protein B5M56_02485 [Desulfococcus sp. 4484_241]|nr:MAG: hypothetical protein B5M56_02485 [Desulfococcus sp. 4484_241]
MKNKNRNMGLVVMAISLCLLFSAAPAFAAGKGLIELKSVAEVEVKAFNDEGKKVLVRKPAGKVLPGDEVIYTTYYRNIGKKAAENVVITNPVPEHMVYKASSAAGKDARITFSADNGKTFHPEGRLYVTGPDGKKRPANPEDYTHVRWTITKSLPPGAEGFVTYRAVLK